jgi:hypothetical protein
MPAPEVSVVIVNYNGRHHLAQCLPSVLASQGFELELIVVDNASTDGSILWLTQHFPHIRTISLTRNLGFGAANYQGLLLARSKRIVFLNSDTVVTPHWLQPLVTTLDAQPDMIRAVCSQLVLLHHPHNLNALGGGMSQLGYGYDHWFGYALDHPMIEACHHQSSIPTLFPTAAAMMIRKQDFLNLGGFDPAFFMYHEDVDLGWRIWLAGGDVLVCPQSVVYHVFGGTTKQTKSATFRNYMGMRHNIRTLCKCYQPRRLARVLLEQARIWHRRRAYHEWLLVTLWNLWHAPGTLTQRYHIQRQRQRSDLDFFEAGLINAALQPPWGPMLPSHETMPPPPRIRAPYLYLADELAPLRCGQGWYPVEYAPNNRVQPGQGWIIPPAINPVPCRWTNGVAHAWLYVAPHDHGWLSLRVRPPGQDSLQLNPEPTWIRLQCGKPDTPNATQYDQRFDASIPPNNREAWITLRFTVTADDQGCLPIVIESSTWAPERHYPQEQPRLMGCAVYDIRFESTVNKARTWSAQAVSVIIPTYNRCHVLQRTLTALHNQQCRDFEVIIVDDGSQDQTSAMINHWWQSYQQTAPFHLQVHHQTNQTQGPARNHGLRHARGDLIFFLGDDIIPEPNWLTAHLDAHNRWNQAGDVAIIGHTDWDCQTMQVTPFLEFINNHGPQFGYHHLTPGAMAPFTCFYTSNISIAREALGSDPFDPRFTVYGWEDCELGFRLCQQGLRILYQPQARAVHDHPMTLRQFIARQRQVGAALTTFADIHPDILTTPAMGDIERQVRRAWLAPLLHPMLPIIDWLDRRYALNWPLRFYALLVNVAFGAGVNRSQ